MPVEPLLRCLQFAGLCGQDAERVSSALTHDTFTEHSLREAKGVLRPEIPSSLRWANTLGWFSGVIGHADR